MLICLSLALIAGLLMSRAAKAVRLPAVTAYLLTGLLLGPFFLGRLGLSRFGFGFGSLAAVEGYGILTQVALGFIAFVIGNEFRLSALKHMGRRAVTVGVAQAVITTALVDIALVALHFARPDAISLASAITLGSIAAATAPAATLMVVKQYKADGPLTKLLLMVVAIDDAVGLVLFSASYGVANALEQGRIDPVSVVLEPLLEIALSLALGAAAGYLLNLLEVYFHSRSKRMSLSVAFVLLTVGLSMTEFEINGTRCGFSLLALSFIEGLSPGADILRVFHQLFRGLMLRLECLLAGQLLLGGGHHFDAQRGGFQVGWQGLHAGAHTLDRCIQVALGLRQAVGVNTHGPKRGSAGV